MKKYSLWIRSHTIKLSEVWVWERGGTHFKATFQTRNTQKCWCCNQSVLAFLSFRHPLHNYSLQLHLEKSFPIIMGNACSGCWLTRGSAAGEQRWVKATLYIHNANSFDINSASQWLLIGRMVSLSQPPMACFCSVYLQWAGRIRVPNTLDRITTISVFPLWCPLAALPQVS